MSFPDFLTPWAGAPATAPPLQVLVLGALAEAFINRRNAIGFCADCTPMCPDHAQDLADAAAYEAAYMRIRGIGSDGAMLTILGGLT